MRSTSSPRSTSRPHSPFLKRVAYPIGNLNGSICIGTYRLTFTVEYLSQGPLVKYFPNQSVIPNAWCRLHHNCSRSPPTIIDYSLTMETACDMFVALLAFLLQCLGWFFQSCMDLTMWGPDPSHLGLVACLPHSVSPLRIVIQLLEVAG